MHRFFPLLLLNIVCLSCSSVFAADNWQRSMDAAALSIKNKQPKVAEQNFLAAAKQAQVENSAFKKILTATLAGQYFASSGQVDAAIKQFQQGLSLKPDSNECAKGLAESYLKKNQKDLALKYRTRLLELKNEGSEFDFGPMMKRMNSDVRVGFGHKVKTYFSQAVQNSITHSAVQFGIDNHGTIKAVCVSASSGNAAYDRMCEGEIERLSVLKDVPSKLNQNTYIEYSFDMQKIPHTDRLAKDLNNARKFLTDAQELSTPDSPVLAYYLCDYASLCTKSKDFATAITNYSEAQKIVDTNPKAEKSAAMVYGGLADCYREKGDLEQARSTYKAGLDAASKCSPFELADYLHGYGTLLYKLGRATEGDECFAKERDLRNSRASSASVK